MSADQHDHVRAALRELAGSLGLIPEGDERALPASHNANMMQIESTLGAFGAALRRVHDAPLGNLRSRLPETIVGMESGSSGRTSMGGTCVDPVSTVELVRKRVKRHHDRLTQEPMSGPYAHMTRGQLVTLLEERLDLVERRGDELVLLQGSPTLDNLHLIGPMTEGFTDWSSVALGDRHFDLAFASRDLVVTCGPWGLSVFLDAYGLGLVDPVRLDWYSHAVELLA